MAQIIMLGALIGLLVYIVVFLMETYVLRAILCQGKALYCSSAPQYANIVAAVISLGGGLVGLVKLQVFRPLFVALCAVISLWGITGIVAILPWYQIAFVSIIIYALAYGAFAWIARIRLFSLAALIAFLLVILIRFVLVA
jgi:hypothetical protein